MAGVRLAVMGDVGTTADSAATLAAVARAHARAPFAAGLLVGDLSYADGNQSVWDDWALLSAPLAAALPVFSLVGNHEWFDTAAAPCDYTQPPFCNYTLAAYLARRRGLPVAGGADPAAAPTAANLYYSVDLGLVHLVVLQSYCPAMQATSAQPCLAPGSPQAAWLAADLARVDRRATPWVVAAWHQPFVNSNTAHGMATEGAPLQAALEPLLAAAGGVDLALAGHVHAYERSCRCVNLTCGAENGTVYVTVGDGGNREGLAARWVEPQPAWSAYRNASFGHGELWAPNETHLRWEWRPNAALGGVGDAVWLVQGGGGGGGGGAGVREWGDAPGGRTALG